MKADDIRLICSGQCKVGEWWKTTADGGLNRLYYINGGKGGYIKNGERIPFQAGMLYLIPYYANIITYTDLEDKLEHTYVAFTSAHPILSTDVMMIDPGSSNWLKCALPAFIDFCKLNYLYRTAPKPYPNEDELNLLKAITAYVTEKMLTVHDDRVIEDATVISALNMMTESLNVRLTVADLAEKHEMTTNGFIKKFTRCVGETPYSYMKKLKTRTAVMLRESGMTLEKAAEACGYSDASALLHAISSSNRKKGK